MTQRILLDVTEAAMNGQRTGIQRVVWNTLLEMARFSNKDLEVMPVIIGSEGVTVYRQNVSNVFMGGTTQQTEPEQETPHWAAGNSAYRALSRAWIRIESSKFGFLLRTKPAYFLADFAIATFRRFSLSESVSENDTKRTSEHEARFRFSENDHLVLLDSFWGRGLGGLAALEEASLQCKSTLWLVHDLIPITHPDLVPSKMANDFPSLVESISSIPSKLGFVSNYSKTIYQSVVGYDNSIPTRVFHLPPGVKSDPNHSGSRTANSIAVVGTVDKRKNLELVVEWFRKHGHSDYSVTVIGRPGWGTNQLEKEMRNLSEETGGRFMWLDDASDEELKSYLQTSTIGLFPSLVEGYGLPLVEFGEAGLAVVASDIPVFREIASEGAVFFDPRDASSLDAAIRSAKTQSTLGTKASTWDAFARSIVEFSIE